MPLCDAPLLLPYCKPMILWLSASWSGENIRRFSSATLTPIVGPSQFFFCACCLFFYSSFFFLIVVHTITEMMEIRDEVCSTYHSTESKDAVDHLYKVKIYHLETSMRKRLKIERHSFFFSSFKLILPCRGSCARTDRWLETGPATWARNSRSPSGTVRHSPSNQIKKNKNKIRDEGKSSGARTDNTIRNRVIMKRNIFQKRQKKKKKEEE